MQVDAGTTEGQAGGTTTQDHVEQQPTAEQAPEVVSDEDHIRQERRRNEVQQPAPSSVLLIGYSIVFFFL